MCINEHVQQVEDRSFILVMENPNMKKDVVITCEVEVNKYILVKEEVIQDVLP